MGGNRGERGTEDGEIKHAMGDLASPTVVASPLQRGTYVKRVRQESGVRVQTRLYRQQYLQRLVKFCGQVGRSGRNLGDRGGQASPAVLYLTVSIRM